MGKIRKGILGGFSGKVGTVIGSQWKGMEYMRSVSGPRKGKFTQLQIEQQAKFGVAVKSIQPLQPAIAIGYRTSSGQITPVNSAVSDLLQNALVGEYPNYSVDYELLHIAKGVLLAPSGCTVAEQDGEAVVTWKNPKRYARGSADDLAILVSMGENCIPGFNLLETNRGSGTASVELPIGEPGTTVYIYLAFASSKTQDVSNSVLAGTLTL